MILGMWTDIADLRDFYGTALGTRARELLARKIATFWPNLHGMTVLGVGFATPFLDHLQDGAARTIALMPAGQGVMPWPRHGGSLVGLCAPEALPLPDRSIDRLLLIHGLESAEHPRAVLREIWRVLADGGRVLIIAPNRHGLWCHFEHTPFGQGQPYTQRQIHRLLCDTMFTPLRTAGALYLPPVKRRWAERFAPSSERIGERIGSSLAGVLLVEASKQIYAGHPLAEPMPRLRLIPSLGPIRPHPHTEAHPPHQTSEASDI